MAGGINSTANLPSLLFPGIRALFGTNYKDQPAKYPALFDEVPSDKQYEVYQQLTGFPDVGTVKAEGAPILMTGNSQGFTYRLTNDAVALGFIVTLEAVKDNLYENTAQARTKMLVRAMRLAKEYKAATIFNQGFNSAVTYADGSPLFSASHVTMQGGTQSNILGTGNIAGADLSEAAIEDMLVQMSLALDDTGFPIDLEGQSLHIHPSQRYNAQRILKSAGQSGTANNDDNALAAMRMLPKGVFVNPYFTSPGAWFIRSDVPHGEGLIYQVREAADLSMEVSEVNKTYTHVAYERYKFGNVDFRSCYGSNGP